MKTLVIHPFDVSTTFLSDIYDEMKDCTVINNNISNEDLTILINLNDRIIMLGHGDAFGLYDLKEHKYVIDSEYADLLKTKECICIWCNANVFVKEHSLNCTLYSGMIVSDLDEAITYSLVNGKVREAIENVAFSNRLFAMSIKEVLANKDIGSILDIYKSECNPIILFNKNNIFI